MIILNDLHLDTQRAAGTTQQSVYDLNQWLLQWLESTLTDRPGEDVLFNGDLFDKFNVSNSILLSLYSVLLHHALTGAKIYLVRGNHDYANDSTKMPSIELLYNLLAKVCQVEYIAEEAREIRDGVWVLPHLRNQDIFSAALKDMLTKRPKILFLHCNYDNGFSLESDHSLNISRDIAKQFAGMGTTLILGHEHHGRVASNAIILGNQLPTSIYDCLGVGDKHYHLLSDDNEVIPVVSWLREGYIEVDGQEDFTQLPNHYQFIRIIGTVSPEEFPAINRKITDLRKSHEAYVISSALKIASSVAEADLATATDQLSQFSILPEILKLVKNKKQNEALKGIIMEMEEKTA